MEIVTWDRADHFNNNGTPHNISKPDTIRLKASLLILTWTRSPI